MSHPLERIGMLLLGVTSTLCAAAAVAVFILWVIDQSPGGHGATRELGVAIALALVAGACALGRRLLQRRANRSGLTRPTAGSLHG